MEAQKRRAEAERSLRGRARALLARLPGGGASAGEREGEGVLDGEVIVPPAVPQQQQQQHMAAKKKQAAAKKQHAAAKKQRGQQRPGPLACIKALAVAVGYSCVVATCACCSACCMCY